MKNLKTCCYAKIQDPDYTIRMLRPNHDDNMTAYAVSSQVNNQLNGNFHLIKKGAIN